MRERERERIKSETVRERVNKESERIKRVRPEKREGGRQNIDKVR